MGRAGRDGCGAVALLSLSGAARCHGTSRARSPVLLSGMVTADARAVGGPRA